MLADSNYLSDVRSFLRVWYEDKHRFPANEVEFREALAKGPAAWQYRVRPVPESEYRQGGKSLPYEIVVETNAIGPRLQDMSQRPGVVYYCVREDLQEFWVTMTALQDDYGLSSIKRVGRQPSAEVMVITQQEKIILDVIPTAATAILEQPDRFELLSLNPQGPAGAAGVNYHGTRVVRTVIVNDPETRKRLVSSFEKAVDENQGTAAACFNPRHGIRVSRKQKQVEFVICFECNRVRVFGVVQGEFLLTSSAQPFFDSVLGNKGSNE
jgi:hypothetical protein